MTNGKYYYSVKITEDMLSTGKVDNTSIVQYLAVVQEGGIDKIIIENY